MQARHCTFVKSGPPTANPSSVSHWQQLWRTRLLHVLQSPYVSNLSTAQTRCDGLTLSTGRDHAARHTCFIVNNYFEISAFFPFVLPQGTRLCNSVTTWRISKPSVHKDCPRPGWKHTGKKKGGIMEKGRPMLLGFHVPGLHSQNQAGFSFWPSASLPS